MRCSRGAFPSAARASHRALQGSGDTPLLCPRTSRRVLVCSPRRAGGPERSRPALPSQPIPLPEVPCAEDTAGCTGRQLHGSEKKLCQMVRTEPKRALRSGGVGVVVAWRLSRGRRFGVPCPSLVDVARVASSVGGAEGVRCTGREITCAESDSTQYPPSSISPKPRAQEWARGGFPRCVQLQAHASRSRIRIVSEGYENRRCGVPTSRTAVRVRHLEKTNHD